MAADLQLHMCQISLGFLSLKLHACHLPIPHNQGIILPLKAMMMQHFTYYFSSWIASRDYPLAILRSELEHHQFETGK